VDIETLYLPDLLSGITIQAERGILSAIHFGTRQADRAGACVREVEKQLREYLRGARETFDLPLDLRGTPFQLRVWRALLEIPYGRTASYRDIANAIGCVKGYQAIGQANHRNPIPIVVPCHRVIAADGSIGGYGGGLDRKRELLNVEAGLFPSFSQ
jgi:O-6-methylguanine DNA methyltransferase